MEEGVNFRTLANWLGHADGGILVSKTYGHLRQEFSDEEDDVRSRLVSPLSSRSPLSDLN